MTESEKKKKSAPIPPSENSLQFQIPRSLALILCIVLSVPYLIAAGYFLHRARTASDSSEPLTIRSATRPSTSSSAQEKSELLLKPGPWGEVEYVPLFIECPDDYLSAQMDATADRRWFFSGFTAEKLSNYFSAIPELSAGDRKLIAEAKLETSPGGVYITPPSQLIFSLNAEARKKIYRFLTQFPENNWQREAYVFPQDSFDKYFKDSEVPAETVSLVRKLCYSYGKTLLFADVPYVLDTLPTFDQKKNLEKAISRRSTMLLRLHVNPRSDLSSLVNYWGRGGTSKDLKPLLESVGKLPQGERINIALLLPPLPAARLYTYPFPSFNQPENCHWTSFNFFRDPPDNRYSDLKFLKERLDADYYPMFTDPKYGDLVFLTKPNGDIVHSAIFVADDIVFTKNGGHFSAPWIFMRLPELVDSYSTFVNENESLKTMYYRNKYF